MPIIPRYPIYSCSPISYLSDSSMIIINDDDIYSMKDIYSAKDVYEKFSNIYVSSTVKNRTVLIKHIIDSIYHPVYIHLLKTIDIYNCHYVLGYLRSQRSIELYNTLKSVVQLYSL